MNEQSQFDDPRDWRMDGEAFHALELLMQEREEWERDQKVQQEYRQYLDQLKQEEQHEMD